MSGGPAGSAGRRGLVALGDSITVGPGSTTPGSWAQWLARALDLPLTSYARDGATTADVLREQLPRVRADYDVAALYVGVNDVRDPGFDLAAYARDLEAVAARLAPRAQRLLVLTLPHDLGRPSSAPKPLRANEVVWRVGRRHHASVVDLSDFGGRALVQPDAVHPTERGQLEIADRAARALGAPRLPSSLAGERLGPALRDAPATARAAARDLLGDGH